MVATGDLYVRLKQRGLPTTQLGLTVGLFQYPQYGSASPKPMRSLGDPSSGMAKPASIPMKCCVGDLPRRHRHQNGLDQIRLKVYEHYCFWTFILEIDLVQSWTPGIYNPSKNPPNRRKVEEKLYIQMQCDPGPPSNRPLIRRSNVGVDAPADSCLVFVAPCKWLTGLDGHDSMVRREIRQKKSVKAEHGLTTDMLRCKNHPQPLKSTKQNTYAELPAWRQTINTTEAQNHSTKGNVQVGDNQAITPSSPRDLS